MVSPWRSRRLPAAGDTARAQVRIGVEVGGTFTDWVVMEDDRVARIGKVLSTPPRPEVGVLDSGRFASLHPGGKLGKRLARVESLMHSGDAVPRVSSKTKMPEVIYEMSRKKLGVTTVVEKDKLLGVISDGDLRRLLERCGKDALDLTAGECMTRDPQTVLENEFAATALAIMEQRKITSLVVVDQDSKVQGIVHLHDLWGTEMV